MKIAIRTRRFLSAIGMLLAMAVAMLLSLLAAGCEDPYNVEEPVFDVRTDKTTYSVDEEITFQLEGSPDMINFYGGAIGNDYQYHDKARIYDMIPTLSFRSAKFAGNNEDCAALLYTTDFNENYDYANVKRVNWIDISDRFTIPPIVGTSATYTESGTVDISNLIVEGKPLYFAWHCKTNEASERTRFQVQNFSVNGESNENPDISGALYTQAQLGFKWVLNEEAAAELPNNLPSTTNTLVYWNGIFNNLDGPLKEGYAVSGPVTITEEINLGFDKPQVIKSVQNENISSFSYTFDKAGEYEVVFVGFNVNYSGKKEVVRKIKLTIEE